MALPIYDNSFNIVTKNVPEPILAFPVLDKAKNVVPAYLTFKQVRWLAEAGVTFNQKAVLGAAAVFLDVLNSWEEQKMNKLIWEAYEEKRHATTTEWRAITGLLNAGMIEKGPKGYRTINRVR